MNKITVLYIDDEEFNLSAFKASFRRIFNVYIANSAEEGLAILNDRIIHVVIADQKMPDTTGIQFFESIINSYPSPTRILVTGYSDINAVIDAINKGQVYRYIPKPWNESELKTTIEKAYQLYALREQNNKLHFEYLKIFETSLDPIVLFDKQGRIIDCNLASFNLLGITNDKIGSEMFSSLIHNESDVVWIKDKLRKEGLIKNFECQIDLKSNIIKKCLVSVNEVTNDPGGIISYQAIIKNVTGRNN